MERHFVLTTTCCEDSRPIPLSHVFDSLDELYEFFIGFYIYDGGEADSEETNWAEWQWSSPEETDKIKKLIAEKKYEELLDFYATLYRDYVSISEQTKNDNGEIETKWIR